VKICVLLRSVLGFREHLLGDEKEWIGDALSVWVEDGEFGAGVADREKPAWYLELAGLG
jgi:hypothetical protein